MSTNSLNNRRKFLKNTAALSGAALVFNPFDGEAAPADLYEGANIRIKKPEKSSYFQPLEAVSVELGSAAHQLTVADGQGRIYFRKEKPGQSVQFKAAGALGYHRLTLTDKKGRLLDSASFPLHCETALQDEGGTFAELFDVLYHTMYRSNYSSGKMVRYNQKYYRYYSSWFQDHVYVAEGLKYFEPDLKTGIDLYADGQREDGLIWDNYKHPYPEKQSFWEYRFDYGGFTYRPEDPLSTAVFVRIPVENIGEHTFLEGLYFAWKATGDTEWMKTRLDNALKAVRFATSSPWYWNEEKKLLKRPFSIDRWDFQSDFDAKITEKDFMGADLGKTRYGIMFGDNICMANGCQWLAEMLDAAERPQDATEMRTLSQNLWQRINELSWNGDFYRHWVPVENQQELDFGVDTSRQVTLSNAMALLRGLEHEKAVKVIQTYQRIRKEMPESSPGEWYLCYPPFEKGWHIGKWEYMNGGVSPILAGDLALGAFEHGYESYGADILQRLLALAKRSPDRLLDGCYKGKLPKAPQRNFMEIDLAAYATHGLSGEGKQGQAWPGGETADFRNLPTGKQQFAEIPFHIVPPGENDGKSCAVISSRHQERLSIPIQQTAKSIYLLHTSTASAVAGTFIIRYADGSSHHRYIQKGKEIGHYWYPVMEVSQKGIPSTLVAWRGPSKVVQDVGTYLFGMDNPHPEKTIQSLEFYNPMASDWILMGLTLSDAPHYLPPPIGSTIPYHWAAAHVFKALMEGMAGAVSTGKAFEKATLKPRWETAGISKAEVTARYVPSNSYLHYQYQKNADGSLEVEFSTNGETTEVELLIPEGKSPQKMLLNGAEVPFSIKTVEGSRYACTTVQGLGAQEIILKI